jgi:iron-sulfur cluster repair protein YtfE (RIC family)
MNAKSPTLPKIPGTDSTEAVQFTAAGEVGAKSAVDQVTRTLDEDHAVVASLTARLEAATDDRGALTDTLDDLAQTLRGHFAEEEQPLGFYGILAVKGPELQARTARLVAEHQELLQDLQHLLTQAQERPAPTPALGRAAAELTARLHEHERRELTLVQALA